MDDLKLHERLTALASDVPSRTSVPPGLVGRARRRGALVLTAAVASIVAVTVVAGVAVRSLLRADPTRPAVTGPVVPGPAAEEGITVIVAGDGGAAGGAVVLDPDGASTATQLPLDRTAFPLAWSPDGRSIAVSDTSGSGLAVVAGDGSVRRLVGAGNPVVGASWSPDGERIVFGSGPPFEAGLDVVAADGTGSRVLLPATDRDWFLFPAWSPDGSTIAFMRGDATLVGCPQNCDRGAELWAMDPDGTNVRPLVTELTIGGRSYTPPVWSPDGSRIAFAAYVDEHGGDVELFVVDADGSGLRQVTDGPGEAKTPAWSPDGTSIAFLRPTDGGRELWIVGADGSDERRMPNAPLVFANSSVIWGDVRAP